MYICIYVAIFTFTNIYHHIPSHIDFLIQQCENLLLYFFSAGRTCTLISCHNKEILFLQSTNCSSWWDWVSFSMFARKICVYGKYKIITFIEPQQGDSVNFAFNEDYNDDFYMWMIFCPVLTDFTTEQVKSCAWTKKYVYYKIMHYH